MLPPPSYQAPNKEHLPPPHPLRFRGKHQEQRTTGRAPIVQNLTASKTDLQHKAIATHIPPVQPLPAQKASHTTRCRLQTRALIPSAQAYLDQITRRRTHHLNTFISSLTSQKQSHHDTITALEIEYTTQLAELLAHQTELQSWDLGAVKLRFKAKPKADGGPLADGNNGPSGLGEAGEAAAVGVESKAKEEEARTATLNERMTLFATQVTAAQGQFDRLKTRREEIDGEIARLCEEVTAYLGEEESSARAERRAGRARELEGEMKAAVDDAIKVWEKMERDFKAKRARHGESLQRMYLEIGGRSQD